MEEGEEEREEKERFNFHLNRLFIFTFSSLING